MRQSAFAVAAVLALGCGSVQAGENPIGEPVEINGL